MLLNISARSNFLGRVAGGGYDLSKWYFGGIPIIKAMENYVSLYNIVAAEFIAFI